MLLLGGKADGLSLSLFAWNPILVKKKTHPFGDGVESYRAHTQPCCLALCFDVPSYQLYDLGLT